jgi:hypothetical protein
MQKSAPSPRKAKSAPSPRKAKSAPSPRKTKSATSSPKKPVAPRKTLLPLLRPLRPLPPYRPLPPPNISTIPDEIRLQILDSVLKFPKRLDNKLLLDYFKIMSNVSKVNKSFSKIIPSITLSWNNITIINLRDLEITKAIKTAINILGNACKNSAKGLPFLRKLDTKKRSKLKISAAQRMDKKTEDKTCSKIR